jgi:adenosine deaminase
VNDHRIPLEMCPSSNVQTRSVADMRSHPLKFYFDFGLRVTVNTDNRLITDTTSTKELWIAHRDMGFTLEDLVTLVVQGFKSAFLPFREKSDLLKQVNREIASTLARFASGPRPVGTANATAAPR